MAVLQFIDSLTQAIDTDNHNVSIFLDLNRAFDMVDHSILPGKLSHYGGRGLALKFVYQTENNKL